MRRRVAVVVLSVSALWALSAPVQAHSGEETYVYLEIFDDTIEGRVEYPMADLYEVIGAPVPGSADSAAGAIAARSQQIVAYTDSHLDLGPTGASWPLRFAEIELLDTENGLYVVVPFQVEERFDPMPRTFEATFDGVVEAKPERSALLLIATDWRSGTFNNEAEHLLVFTQERTTQLVDLGEPSTIAAIIGVVALGVEHIQIGSDHILFILALLLPAVLVFHRGIGWRPAESFGSGLWRVVKIATSFTVAHTITLTLGGLGVVTLSPSLVEPVIAASIALAALHNLRPVFSNREWLIAFLFGLFHGFGFAGLLSDLGLDRSNRLVSLLGFNLGIELGQVAIIVLLFPALFLLRRTLLYVSFMRVGSMVLVLVATGWFVDRTFGLDLGVDRIVEPFLAWPRPLWEVAVFALLAWAYFSLERRRGRLVPVEVPVGDGAVALESVRTAGET